MNRKYISALSIVAAMAIGLSNREQVEAKTVSEESEASVEFGNTDDQLIPMDPEDKEPDDKVITPIYPPNNGPLGISYASSIVFEPKIISKNDSLLSYAQPDTITQVETNKSTKVPNFIQVQDLRGEGTGWKLKVKLDAEFANENGAKLTGAKVVIPIQSVEAHYGTPNPPSTFDKQVTLERTGEYYDVLKANDGEGMSVWNIILGDIKTKENNISLNVPEKVITESGQYSTSLTWSIESVI